jgi:hypothetical protein
MNLNYDKTRYLFLTTKKLREYFRKTNSVVSTSGKWKDFNAFACVSTNSIIIHLDAHFWKFLIGLGEECSLIEEISKSLVHENCHLVIGEFGFTSRNYDTEEKIVRIMAGQD